MKKKQFTQIKSSSLEELENLLKKFQLEAVKTKLELKKGKTKNVHLFQAKRKEIAQIKTLITERSSK